MKEKSSMCEMDTPDVKTITAMAHSLSAESIVAHFNERGANLKIVKGELYPVGIKMGNTTLFLAALQPKEEKTVSD
jgi:hypothetical protein